MDNPHIPSIRRAALPEVMLVPDVGLALGGIKDSAARKAILRGDCGPYIRVGRRLAVLRESFLEALAARQEQPIAPKRAPKVPAAKARYIKLLKSHEKKVQR